MNLYSVKEEIHGSSNINNCEAFEARQHLKVDMTHYDAILQLQKCLIDDSQFLYYQLVEQELINVTV